MDDIRLFDDLFQSFTSNNNLYNTITEISKSGKPHYISAVEDNTKIFAMDELSKKIHKYIHKNDDDKNRHSSVDGFYYRKRRDGKLDLLFIEFKVINNINQNYRRILKEKIRPSLRLKSLESLNCILPHLIFQNCSEEISKNLNKLIFDSKKYYFCVILNPNISETNAQAIINSDYVDIERLSPFPFDKVYLKSPKKFKTFFTKIVQSSE
ncbi:MAG: hypothetical protein FWH29_02070 [Methanobrevibacter sp.]|nr:hypothetical protein [Methanobrevibacter sp.]